MSLELEDGTTGKRYVGMAASLLDGDDNANLLYTLGKYHAKNNDLAASERYFRQVTGNQFDALRAQYYLGVILVRQGKFREAVVPFKGVAESNPPEDANPGQYEELTSQAWLALARLAYERSDFAQAVDYYNQVSTQASAFDDAMHELVWIAVKQGDYDKALRKLDLLLISQPDVLKGPDARLLEGKLTLMKQDYQGARTAFEALSQQFGAIQSEMSSIEKAHPNLEVHFGKVVGDRIAEFDLRSVLPLRPLSSPANLWAPRKICGSSVMSPHKGVIWTPQNELQKSSRLLCLQTIERRCSRRFTPVCLRRLNSRPC